LRALEVQPANFFSFSFLVELLISTLKKRVRATLHAVVLPPRRSAGRTTAPTRGPAPSLPPDATWWLGVPLPSPLAPHGVPPPGCPELPRSGRSALDLHHCSGDATRGRFLTRMLTQGAWHHGTKRSSAATDSRSSCEFQIPAQSHWLEVQPPSLSRRAPKSTTSFPSPI
jgi:hypothetical protein